MEHLTRQQRRQYERKLSNPNYKEGFITGVQYGQNLWEDVIHQAVERTKGIGEKRRAELRENIIKVFHEVMKKEGNMRVEV